MSPKTGENGESIFFNGESIVYLHTAYCLFIDPELDI